MLLTLMPPAVFFGYGFARSVLRGCLGAPGLTPLGYALMLYPGVTSAACLGTLILRFCDKPSAWLAWISAALVLALPFLGFIALLIVMAMAIPLWAGGMMLAIALISVIALLLACRGDTVASAAPPDAPRPATAP